MKGHGGYQFIEHVDGGNGVGTKVRDEKVAEGTGKNKNKNLRYQPGTVNQSFNLERSLQTQKKFMYNKGSIGVIPKEVRNQLIGKYFNSFDDFRKEFWKSVANTNFAEEFNNRNITRMLEGNAPIAPKLEHYGKHKSYILHHKQPIDKGGEVYNLDNLIITSPKMHQSILDPAYHFGKKGH
nr:HNH endonuclease [Priestia flexa]WEZ07876.1 HNH endonuclease [Priestia flexa]